MKARKVKHLDPQETLVENAARIVAARLDELCSFVPAALKRGNAEQQHDMRIAAKRLRYVLETTEFCFGRAGETARRRAKALQEVLGELHDCDVMLPRIEGQIAALRDEDAKAVRRLAGDAEDLDPAHSARAPHRTAYRGLEVLAIHVKARRRLLFDNFRSLWAEIDDSGVWKRLERAMDRAVAAAQERRAVVERAARAAAELEAARRAEEEAGDRAREAAAALAAAERARGTATPRPGGDVVPAPTPPATVDSSSPDAPGVEEPDRAEEPVPSPVPVASTNGGETVEGS